MRTPRNLPKGEPGLAGVVPPLEPRAKLAAESSWRARARTIVEWFIPPGFAKSDPDAARRARLIVLLTGLVYFIGPVYVLTFYWAGYPQLALANAVASIMISTTPFLIRRTGSLALAGNVFAASLFFVIGVQAFASGGPLSPGIGWTATLPVAGFALAGPRSGIIWTILAVCLVTALFYAKSIGVTFPIVFPEDVHANLAMGAVVGLIGVILCFTLLFEFLAQNAMRDFRIANRELAEARDKAQTASRIKSEFLANMSHEIRTPMNGVLGMTELLLETNLSETQRKLATRAYQSAEGLLSIINDVLDLSKIEANKIEIESVPCNLRKLIEDCIDMFAEQAHRKHLELLSNVGRDISGTVYTDPSRLRQILTNLLGNAIKFTARGEVTVTVAVVNRTPETLTVRFEVRDTGIGIPPEMNDQLFSAFTQADASTTRRYGGTGLGLAISKRLVENMGGTIGLESHKGQGATFWFTLPFKASTSPEPDGADLREAIEDRRVLIVDDNETNREILKAHLLSWGIRPTAVRSGSEALAALKDGLSAGAPYEMALVDFHMPEMDGVELAAAVHANPAFSDLPFVILSSAGRCCDPETTPGSAEHFWLSKPVRRSDLHDQLERVLLGTPREFTQRNSRVQSRQDSLTKPVARVLLVEDNPVNLEVAVAMLEGFGCRVDAESSGRAGLQAFERTDYDIIFMDCQMPVMDGYETTIAIRALEAQRAAAEGAEPGQYRRTPVIALTANTMQGARDRCISVGMDDYLSKPFTRPRLLGLLKQWIPWMNPDAEEEPGSVDASKQSATSSPGSGITLDRNVIHQLRASDQEPSGEFLTKIVNMYMAQSNKLSRAIGEAIQAVDPAGVARAAHTLKSSSAQVGALKLSLLCKELEEMARSGSLAGASDLFHTLEEELDCATEALAVECFGIRDTHHGDDR